MSSSIPHELRLLVARRAEDVCEYCLVHLRDSFVGFQVDHIISEKHGGPTEAGNLAFACAWCNRQKGSDIGTVAPATGGLVRLFHPRNDRWADHFRLVGVRIEWRTEIGEATVRLLKLNDLHRILEREVLRENRKYPSPVAIQRARGF